MRRQEGDLCPYPSPSLSTLTRSALFEGENGRLSNLAKIGDLGNHRSHRRLHNLGYDQFDGTELIGCAPETDHRSRPNGLHLDPFPFAREISAPVILTGAVPPFDARYNRDLASPSSDYAILQALRRR